MKTRFFLPMLAALAAATIGMSGPAAAKTGLGQAIEMCRQSPHCKLSRDRGGWTLKIRQNHGPKHEDTGTSHPLPRPKTPPVAEPAPTSPPPIVPTNKVTRDHRIAPVVNDHRAKAPVVRDSRKIGGTGTRNTCDKSAKRCEAN